MDQTPPTRGIQRSVASAEECETAIQFKPGGSWEMEVNCLNAFSATVDAGRVLMCVYFILGGQESTGYKFTYWYKDTHVVIAPPL